MLLIWEKIQICSLIVFGGLWRVWTNRKIVLVDQMLWDGFVRVFIFFLCFLNLLNRRVFLIDYRLHIAVILSDDLRSQSLWQFQKILVLVLVSKYRQCINDTISMGNHVLDYLQLIQHFIEILILCLRGFAWIGKVQWAFRGKTLIILLILRIFMLFFVTVQLQLLLIVILLKFLVRIHLLSLLLLRLFIIWLSLIFYLRFVVKL